MMPVGPLMIEHRLIERMVAPIEKELKRMRETKKADVDFVDSIVDFIRTYADKCHHGKEEAMLFAELDKKAISDKHKNTMKQLLEEHVLARKVVGELVGANDKYRNGDEKVVGAIAEQLRKLADLYPKHIETEDKHFFLEVMDYFTEDEMQSMLERMRDLDAKMIHEEYKGKIEELEE